MQRALANDVPSMVNKNASLAEQAFQAVQIKNDLTMTLRMAMDDANAAAQLSMISPIRSFDEMVRSRSQEYAGDALYRQVIADAQMQMRQATKAPAPYGLCFAAGTLIHTQEGLKPIEQIQVGDWVLTQPEETGERIYKRVTRTTQFEDAAVWTVAYFLKDEQDKAIAENRMMPRDCNYRLVVTPNHPLWVRGKGWVQVKDLDCDADELELADGGVARLLNVSPLYRTEMEGVAWEEGMFTSWDGTLHDLRGGRSVEKSFRATGAQQAIQSDFVERWDESCYFHCSVYNFEVEDCYTYYVGTLGVWVHNTNCGEMLCERVIAIRNGLAPSRGAGLYFTG
ncbi:Hint domain-containing protein [Pseudomonas indica]|uniref:Hint domain-containing protein n=1 Tax=Pseudomonas indica TaxID=137658 RepID=UPI003FCF6406